MRGGVARGEPGEGQGRHSEDAWEKFEKAKLSELLDLDESPTAFLLRYTITHPHCHTTIVGTLVRSHLEDNLKTVARGPLSVEVYQEAKKRLDAIGESPKD